MDLDSWENKDVARRLATVAAGLIGVTAFLGLWLGVPVHFLLGLLGGTLAGVVSFWVLHPVLRIMLR